MINEIKGSSIFLIGKPKITYEKIPRDDDSAESLTFDMSFDKRMFESECADYSSANESYINARSKYKENIAKSFSFHR